MPSLDEELRTELAHPGSAQRSLIIVGSGVSIGATWGQPMARAAAWKGLLELGLERCSDLGVQTSAWANAEKRKLRKGDLDSYLAVATEIENRLGAPENGEFASFLKTTVGSLAAPDHSVLESLAALANLGVPIATTNYDGLLEQRTGLDAITWQQMPRVQEVLRGDDRAILHLHGYWREPASVVLGQRSYDRVLQSPQAQATLRQILANRSVVFIGCGEGLNDPNFSLLLRWAAETLRSSPYKHYKLLPNKDAKTKTGRVPEHRIFSVPYGKTHDDLGPFVQSLLPTRAFPDPAASVSSQPLGQPSSRACGGDLAPAVLPTSAETSPAVTAQASPAVSADGPPVALPPPPQRWYGREQLASDLVHLLLQPIPPALALRGHPGQGKTALATWLLHDPLIASKFGSRRYFVRCEPCRSRVEMAVAMEAALGLSVTQHAEVRAIERLRRGPSLLVLDNLEGLWENDRVEVEELLKQLASMSASHGLGLVVTLRGIERPSGVDWHILPPIPQLSRQASQALFLRIAGPHLASDPKLDTLLSATDDLPLAVELLGYQAEGQPDLEDLWQRWQDERTRILQRYPASSRGSNLQISIDLSVSSRRMTDQAGRMLGMLAQLPAGMLRSDLRKVFGTLGSNGITVLHGIGLAQAEDNRWRLLNPVREHVRENHQNLYNLDDHLTLLRYFQQLTEVGHRRFALGGADINRRLTQEFPNFIAVLWKQASQAQRFARAVPWVGNPIPALQAAANIYEFLYSTALDVDDLVQALLQAAQAKTLIKPAGWCLYILGVRSQIRGKFDDAECLLSDADSYFSQCQEFYGQAFCIERIAEIALSKGQSSIARRLLEDAMQRYVKLGSQHGQTQCLQSLARVAILQGDFSEGWQGLDSARARFTKLNGEIGQIHCTMHLGQIALARGNLSDAQNYVEQAMQRYIEMDEPIGQANCVYFLADIASERGELAEAHRLLTEALQRNVKLGLKLGEAGCAQALAMVALRQGEFPEAQRGLEQSQKRYVDLGLAGGHVMTQWSMAELALAQRQHSLAASRYQEAAARSETNGYKWLLWKCRVGLADTALATGDLDAAERLYVAACAFFRSPSVQDNLRQGDGLFGLTRVARQRGAIDISIGHCRQAIELYRQCGATKRLTECEYELASLEAASALSAGEVGAP